MRSLLNFIKYHNAFSIGVSLVVLVAGVTWAATPAVREAVFPAVMGPVGSPPEANTKLLRTTDPRQFKMDFRVESVRETQDRYSIAYRYSTLEVKDGSWQPVEKLKTLEIPKALLGQRDLGLYAAEQIGQVMDREIAYLEEVRANLRPGSSAPSKQYATLSGKVLDPKERTFGGYQPAVKEEVKSKTVASQTLSLIELPSGEEIAVTPLLSKAEIRQMIVDAVSSFLAIDMSGVASSGETDSPPSLPETTDKPPLSSNAGDAEVGSPVSQEVITPQPNEEQ